ncbi:COG4223 family protein [Albidovulum sediminis]|uniref:Inner membrane protein n=1 Tax=Albidovulum sediminis TaxID=3066345 RepID=A0ABT2NRD6_9RHOB|nr:hypothetical protein [Defluviimonas sediminis]MCT8331245.1 hypothetical protein [Defluviimonas sediminis]
MAKSKHTEGEEPADTVPAGEPEAHEPEASVTAPEAVSAAADADDEPRVPDEQPSPPRRKGSAGGWVGPILGGIIAAGAGFGAAYYALPSAAPTTELKESIAALKAEIGTQDADLTALEGRVATFVPGADPAELAALSERVSAAEASAQAARQAAADGLAGIGDRLTALEERVTAVERLPVSGDGVSPAALQSFEREIAALKAEIERQRGESTTLEERLTSLSAAAEERLRAAEEDAARIRAEAEAEGQRALARAALSHLRAAVESGGAIDGALANLAAAGVTAPAELADQAKGIPTAQLLQARFEAAAREALTVSLREAAGESWADRISAFLRSQTGARSLTPRAGDDPDAVLSRAGAALTAGDIPAAIAEIGALPEGGRAVMAEWIGLAERRVAALNALSALVAAVE